MARILITGITGQDGSYLAEHCLARGDEVFGIMRRLSVAENQSSRIEHLIDKIKTFYGDMLDPFSIQRIMQQVMPDEIFSLAAQSHVRISFDMPAFTIQTNGIGTLNILEAYRTICPNSKFYFAGSSELFGNSIDPDGYQRLTTPMIPVSPYGCAKLLGFNLVRHYRAAYGLHACNGILMNHTSPRRGSNFVESKIIKTAVQIKQGKADRLYLGNLDSKRDWGHSKDYTRAMMAILRHEPAEDFIIATGQSHSIRELCDIVFTKLDLNYQNYVRQDPNLLRPEELKELRGDASKAKDLLGWKPTYTFEQMIDEMMAAQLNKI